jgi:hypothetical protein
VDLSGAEVKQFILLSHIYLSSFFSSSSNHLVVAKTPQDVSGTWS